MQETIKPETFENLDVGERLEITYAKRQIEYSKELIAEHRKIIAEERAIIRRMKARNLRRTK